MIHSQIPGIPAEYCSRILAIFHARSNDVQVILFGSRAKGNFREGSDIDLALKGIGITIEQRDQFLLKYEQLELPWRLDLVIYELVSDPELKSHIDRVGIQLTSGANS